jgi:hypothetical protein
MGIYPQSRSLHSRHESDGLERSDGQGGSQKGVGHSSRPQPSGTSARGDGGTTGMSIPLGACAGATTLERKPKVRCARSMLRQTGR